MMLFAVRMFISSLPYIYIAPDLSVLTTVVRNIKISFQIFPLDLRRKDPNATAPSHVKDTSDRRRN